MDTLRARHHYAPLDQRGDEIRLLRLLAGNTQDPAKGELFHARLEDPTLKFEALSYTWGDPKVTKRISLDGNDNFEVTTNLNLALLDLRHQLEDRILWVDAICINQCDVTERNQQVTIMRFIYSRATNVCVWINIDLSHNLPVFERMKKFGPTSTEADLGEDPSFWRKARTLFSSEYFLRVWVQQELLNASSFGLHCRDFIIPGEAVISFLWQLQCSGHPQGLDSTTGEFFVTWSSWADTYHHIMPNNDMTIAAMQVKRGYWELSNPDTIGSLDLSQNSSFKKPVTTGTVKFNLLSTRHLLATDPRDHVFAILGISNDHDNDLLPIRYDLSAAEIYENVTRFEISKYGTLDFLSQVWHVQASPRHIDNLPSWVVDWSVRPDGLFANQSASGAIEAFKDVDARNRGILKVRGFQVCDISFCSNCGSLADVELCELFSILDKVLQAPDSHNSDTENLFAEFLLPVLLDSLPNGTSESNLLQSLLEVRCLVQDPQSSIGHLTLRQIQYSPNDYDITDPDQQGLVLWLCLAFLEKNFFSTSLGSIGLMFGNTSRARDQVWLIFGCKTLIILRPEGQNYSVIGPALLSGFSSGKEVEDLPVNIADAEHYKNYFIETISLQ